jgi:UDP-N-acetylmuramate--alanine ligase
VVDDYGHHPTEIRAVLETARQAGAGRIVTVFQPHRFTRTQLCWEEFRSCFRDTDVLVLLPIYAASEEPIEGVSSSALLRDIRATVGEGIELHEVETLEEAESWVLRNRKALDLILTLGAGSITRLADRLAQGLSESH